MIFLSDEAHFKDVSWEGLWTENDMLVIILTNRGQCRAGALHLVTLVIFPSIVRCSKDRVKSENRFSPLRPVL